MKLQKLHELFLTYFQALNLNLTSFYPHQVKFFRYEQFCNLQTWSVNYKISQILRNIEIHKKYRTIKCLQFYDDSKNVYVYWVIVIFHFQGTPCANGVRCTDTVFTTPYKGGFCLKTIHSIYNLLYYFTSNYPVTIH